MVDDVATHTGTKERLVIYSHVWPFDPSTLARPYDEWCEEGRFRLLSRDEYVTLMQKDRLEFQIEIGKAKADK